MALSNTQLGFVNDALLLIAEKGIQTSEGNAASQIITEGRFEKTVTKLLGAHRWKFAMTQQELSKHVDPPKAVWSSAYQLPADPKCLLISRVLVLGEPIPFDVYGDFIFADAGDLVVAEFVFRQADELFPPYFENALCFKLAMDYALAITSDPALRREMKNDFYEAFAAAKTLDSQSGITKRLGGRSRLANARRGGA